jgi:hypothetical protein
VVAARGVAADQAVADNRHVVRQLNAGTRVADPDAFQGPGHLHVHPAREVPLQPGHLTVHVVLRTEGEDLELPLHLRPGVHEVRALRTEAVVVLGVPPDQSVLGHHVDVRLEHRAVGQLGGDVAAHLGHAGGPLGQLHLGFDAAHVVAVVEGALHARAVVPDGLALQRGVLLAQHPLPPLGALDLRMPAGEVVHLGAQVGDGVLLRLDLVQHVGGG